MRRIYECKGACALLCSDACAILLLACSGQLLAHHIHEDSDLCLPRDAVLLCGCSVAGTSAGSYQQCPSSHSGSARSLTAQRATATQSHARARAARRRGREEGRRVRHKSARDLPSGRGGCGDGLHAAIGAGRCTGAGASGGGRRQRVRGAAAWRTGHASGSACGRPLLAGAPTRCRAEKGHDCARRAPRAAFLARCTHACCMDARSARAPRPSLSLGHQPVQAPPMQSTSRTEVVRHCGTVGGVSAEAAELPFSETELMSGQPACRRPTSPLASPEMPPPHLCI